MREIKHTPRPWEFVPLGDGSCTDPFVYTQGKIAGNKSYSIAHVYPYPWSVRRAIANARIIAAAPEMLAALVEVVEQYGYAMPLEKAKAAIAKATGKEC